MSEMFSEPMGRRAFLKKSLVGTLVLSSSSLFLTSCALYPAPEKELLFFSSKEFACLNAVCDALIPHDTENLPKPSEAGAVYSIEKLLVWIPEENQKQIKLLLNALEHAPFVFLFSRKPFSLQPLENQRKILSSLENSFLFFGRLAFQTLKMLVMMGYYTRDAAWKAIGYDGPLVKT